MDVTQFKLPDSIRNFAWVGERKAVALLGLGFHATVFALFALIAASQLPEWVPCFVGLALVYAVGFFALAADWFWARWFAVGLGYSGLSMAIFSLISLRQLNGALLVFGILHGLVSLCLLGPKMAEHYESRPDWRARWNLDDQGVLKVRRAVTRAASSLPSLIMFALAPRDGAAALLALGVLGLVGLLRGRTWGVLALAGASIGSFVAYLTTPAVDSLGVEMLTPLALQSLPLISAVLLASAVAPFVPAMASFLARRR